MDKIKYRLSATWIAPNVPMFIKQEDCQAAISDAIACQKQLTSEMKLLELTESEDHHKLFAFQNVSFQLTQLRFGLENVLKYMSGDKPVITHVPDVYTAPMGTSSKRKGGTS